MNNQLETERLLLRHWEASDAESLYDYARNPAVGPIAGWPPHKSVEESRDVIKNVLNGAEAYALWQDIAPKAVVPMHYRRNKPAFGFSVISGPELFLDNFSSGSIQTLEGNSFELTKDGPTGVVIPTPVV